MAETRDETDKANKEFDRWSDDEAPQVKATKEREFDAWSEDSVEVVEQEQKEDQEFFVDAAPDHSLVGVSSKHRAPHPSAPQPAEEARLSPRPPKAPPPAHLLQQAERQAVEWLRKKAEVPAQPPPAPAMAMPAVPRGRPVPPPRLMRPQSAHPVVRPVPPVPPVPHVPQMAGQVPQMPQMPMRQVAVTPVVLVPVSPCATWTCFISLQHGLERMKLLATLLLGDAAAAQALVQDASGNLKLSHRTAFEDVKKAALKAVLQLMPMTDAKDQQARDSLEKYLLSKDRAGVVRVGTRDLYLIPPSKAEACGLKVAPQAKCIVAAVAEKNRSKKSKGTAEVKKKAAEVVVADDTEDSEEPKNNDKKVDNNHDKEDDQKEENKDSEAAAAEEKSEETKKEDTNEDLKAAAPDEKKEEAKPEAKQDKDQASKVPHSPFESLKAQAKPQAKPRFSRLDVENAAFEIARSRDDRQVRPEPSPNLGVPRGPPHPGHGPGPWPAFPEPWWNPYVSPHTDHGAQPERRRKRHRSSKERRRTRRRSKARSPKAGSQDSDTSSQSKSKPSEPAAASHFRNPYIDPVPTEQPTETEENNSEPVDEKWKGLLARVEALAEFCRADSVENE